MDQYHGNGQFPYFFFKLRETQKVFKKRNLIFSSQQYNYSKRNLDVKGYCSKWMKKITKIHQAERCPVPQRNDAM